MSYNPDYEQLGMLRGGYEVDLGVTGYRVCFTRKTLLPELAQLGTLEVALYKSLFPMVAKGRFDLFCRGINEVRDEWPEARQQPEIVLEPAMLLYYDLPRFFYANPRDTKGMQRVDAGLRIAAADGSLLTLWKQHYLPSVEYVQPQKRRLFRLVNPMVSQLKWADKQLVFDPLSGSFNFRDQ